MQGLWTCQTLGHTTTSPVESFNSRLKRALRVWHRSIRGRRLDLLIYVLKRLTAEDGLKEYQAETGQRHNERAAQEVTSRCESARGITKNDIEWPRRLRPHMWRVRSQTIDSVWYDVNDQVATGGCSCLDSSYRRWPCKHSIAVWKLMDTRLDYDDVICYLGNKLNAVDGGLENMWRSLEQYPQEEPDSDDEMEANGDPDEDDDGPGDEQSARSGPIDDGLQSANGVPQEDGPRAPAQTSHLPMLPVSGPAVQERIPAVQERRPAAPPPPQQRDPGQWGPWVAYGQQVVQLLKHGSLHEKNLGLQILISGTNNVSEPLPAWTLERVGMETSTRGQTARHKGPHEKGRKRRRPKGN